MFFPFCNVEDTKVIDSRLVDAGVLNVKNSLPRLKWEN